MSVNGVIDLGDRTEDSTVDFSFTSFSAADVPTVLAGTPVLSVYKANGTTQSTAGITLNVDHDSLVGLNHVRLDLSADAFYAVANDYFVLITTGTIDGVSAVGTVVATFSIENRFAEVDVTKWLGTAVTAATAGIPDVNMKRIRNFQSSADVLSRWLGEGTLGTSDSGTTTTMVDSARTEADDYWNGAVLVFTGGTNVGYSAVVTDFDAATDTLTFTPAVPDAVTTELYVLVPGLGWANVKAINDAVVVGDGNATPWDGA